MSFAPPKLRQADRFRVILATTMLIYALAGKEIYQRRKELNELSAGPGSTVNKDLPTSSEIKETQMTSEAAQNIWEVKDLPMSSKVTEVQITSEPVDTQIVTNVFDENQSEESASAPQKYPLYTVDIESRYLPKTRSGNVHAKRAGPSSSDLAAWAYVKCALLFFIALLITWVNSTPLFHKCQPNVHIFRSPPPLTECIRS